MSHRYHRTNTHLTCYLGGDDPVLTVNSMYYCVTHIHAVYLFLLVKHHSLYYNEGLICSKRRYKTLDEMMLSTGPYLFFIIFFPVISERGSYQLSTVFNNHVASLNGLLAVQTTTLNLRSEVRNNRN